MQEKWKLFLKFLLISNKIVYFGFLSLFLSLSATKIILRLKIYSINYEKLLINISTTEKNM